jgi:hypothetical protein
MFMKKSLIFIAIAVLAIFAYKTTSVKNSREEYEAFLKDHPYMEALQEYDNEEEKNEGEEHENESRPDRPDLAFMQDFLRTMDPSLKRPLPEILDATNKHTALLRDRKLNASRMETGSTSLSTATVWAERGPKQVGGRTRVLVFDANDVTNKKVWAGGITGGLWYNNDITSSSSPWHKVDDFWDNLSISSMSIDPTNSNVMYVGTGESQLGVRGGGIWKTTDGGASWNRLNSTITFLQVRDLAIRNESGVGVVYAAVTPAYGLDNPTYTAGLYRSVDGGSSWLQVLPTIDGFYTELPTDLEVGSDNTLWVGVQKNPEVVSSGSAIYESANGTTWSRTASFTGSALTFKGQVELAIAPSDADIMYAMFEDDGQVAGILRSTNKGNSWVSVSEPVDGDTGIPASDFTRGQAWYDLALAVNPTDVNEVLIGGVDLFKSTNGGTAWVQVSKWWDGFNITAETVHADQHEIVYRPGTSEAIFGNDGGIYYGNNLAAGTNAVSIKTRNLNYNVTQFYTAALHPILANYMLGGTQDNGTQKFTQSGFSSTSVAQDGDGAMCFIDQKDPSIQIVSYVYNDVSLSLDGGATFTQLLSDNNTGSFINTGEYDSNFKVLYTAKNEFSIYRVSNLQTTPVTKTLNINGLGSIATAMRVSPYTTSQSNLYVGTMAGRLFKVANANATQQVTELTGDAFPQGSVSGISFGASEDQIIVSFSNYGVISIWETRDGGATWKNKEGNLPNMPVRWIEYHPQNPDQAYIATELGVWSTDNLNVDAPEWTSTNGGLANVRTEMLRMRKTDGILMAATHGRGVFTALIPSQLEQTITFNDISAKTFGDNPFQLRATSTSQLPVSFASSDPSLASVSGNILTIRGAGSVVISAIQAGNVYYKEADTVKQTIVIAKATQAITFNALPQKTVVDAPFNLTASASSALAISYSSSNTDVATVSGKTVTIVGPGTTTITASQPGNNNYLEADEASQTLTVVTRIIQLTGSLDFGEVVIGEKALMNITIENLGTAPITITKFTLPEGYTETQTVTGNSITVIVTFAPKDVKDYNGEIVVESNKTSGENTMVITGKGISITAAERNLPKEIAVFPNPSKDWITIRASKIGSQKEIAIVDQRGNARILPVESASVNEVKINVSNLSTGIYIIAIPQADKVVYEKFNKE